MHLTEDGFFHLVQRPNPSIGREVLHPELDSKPWFDLWEEFLDEASRFDGKMLIRLFGDTEPVKRPPLQKQFLTLRDRLLIGRLIRRYHSRIAHESRCWECQA